MNQQMQRVLTRMQNGQAAVGNGTIAQDEQNEQGEVDLGSIDLVPLGEGRAYTLAGQTIAVFRQRDGKLFATDNTCPHREGPLADGIIGAGKLICPLHMWKFDLHTGKCLGEDAELRTYPVREVHGRIRISLLA